MRFCDECKRKNNWFGFVTRGFAMCEVCRRTRVCYDVPHDKLAIIPPQPGIKKMKEVMIKTDKVDETVPGEYTIRVDIFQGGYPAVGIRGSARKETLIMSATLSASTLEEVARKAKGMVDVAIPPAA